MTERTIARTRFHPALAILPLARAVTITAAVLAAGYSEWWALWFMAAPIALLIWHTPWQIAVAAGCVTVIVAKAWPWPTVTVIFVAVWTWAIWRAAHYLTRHLELTTERLILHRGIFTTRSESARLRALTDTSIERPFLGQLFGWVHLDVESAGQDQAIKHLRFVPGAGGNTDYWYDLIQQHAQRTPARREL